MTRKSTLQEVAAIVGAHLNHRGIRAVLTGGACVAIHTGTYVSQDADYVVQSNVRQTALAEALGELGFSRDGDRYVHPEVAYFVEFPPGPLSIGDDLAIVPVELRVGKAVTLGLSATDSCRDRLAAFYHWNDRQSLELAVEIARKNQLDLEAIRVWSTAEGKAEEHEEFRRKLSAARRRSTHSQGIRRQRG